MQVNQLVQVAQKCQSTIAEIGSDGVSQQDLQTNSNMWVNALLFLTDWHVFVNPPSQISRLSWLHALSEDVVK